MLVNPSPNTEYCTKADLPEGGGELHPCKLKKPAYAAYGLVDL
jgi:hypothetical protein